MRAKSFLAIALTSTFLFSGIAVAAPAGVKSEEPTRTVLFPAKKVEEPAAAETKKLKKTAAKKGKDGKNKVAKNKAKPEAKTAAKKPAKKKVAEEITTAAAGPGERRSLFTILFSERNAEENAAKPARQTPPSIAKKKKKAVEAETILAVAPTVIQPIGIEPLTPKKKGKATKPVYDPKFEPQSVAYSSEYEPGTIIIDSNSKFLYLIEGWGQARRYGVAVGKEGLGWTGEAAIGDMQEWPRWIPTKEMVERDPKKYAEYDEVGMDGGPQNPLGARAMYLYQGKKDTYIRIHGTNAPSSIGQAASNGCFRMVNEHVMDLYSRVGMGTKVVVM